MAAHAYCCGCGMGPFLLETLYTGCTSCGHCFCANCQIVYPDKRDSEERALSNEAVKADSVEPAIPQLLKSETSPPTSYGVLSHDTCGASPKSATRLSSDDDHSQSPELPLPSQPIIAQPEHASSPSGPAPADGDTYWTCNVCGYGPYLFSLYPACTNCGHIRCTECYYQEA